MELPEDAGMTIVLLLIPLGLVLVALAAWALFWAVDSGQYDGDVESQGLIAVERDEPPSTTCTSTYRLETRAQS